MTREDVSRETLQKLKAFEALLIKWNKSINLVSPKTIPDLWARHIEDSLETALCLTNPTGHWVDLGSGGGFPGIIAAASSRELPGITDFTLIESDKRKCAFLRAAVRELGLSAKIVAQRIDEVPKQNADIVSARALASLTELLAYAVRHAKSSAHLVFPKGVTWKTEVDAARKVFEFDLEVVPSVTQEGSVNLVIQGARRVKHQL